MDAERRRREARRKLQVRPRKPRVGRGAKSSWQKIALYWTGWAFVVLGVLGLFLPILQGILFLLIGLFILSAVSPRIRLLRQRLRRRARTRYPEWTGKFEEAELRANRWMRRIVKSRK